MTVNVEAYFKEVDEMPWGKLFYRLLWQQLDQADLGAVEPLKVLDFGAGFCKTAAYLAAAGHQVTAYEPNREIAAHRYQTANYRFLSGDFAEVKIPLQHEKYDLILLHNVLEYVEDRNEILDFLWSLLVPGGRFSLVKHNPRGRIMVNAVLRDDPAQALAELQGKAGQSVNFGKVIDYTNEWLLDWLDEKDTAVTGDYGIRMFYGLSQNSEIKFTEDWQENMFRLESECQTDAIFKKIAMFRHFLWIK